MASQNSDASRRPASHALFVWITLSVFGTVLAITLWRHEMWRDELQAWMIAQASHSPFDLIFTHMRYEGHPALWHLLLWPLTRLTDNPVAMQALHWALAVGAAYVFLRFAPMAKPLRALFVFGYFPLFEYGAISRSYVLGPLLVFAICAVMQGERRRYLVLGILLFLLTQTTAFGLILAGALSATLGVEWLVQRRWRKPELGRPRNAAIGAGIVVLGMALSVAQIIPPPDGTFAGGRSLNPTSAAAENAVRAVWKSYMPIPDTYHWSARTWNTHYPNANPTVQWFAGLALLAVSVTLFARRPLVLLLYVLGTGALLLFFWIKLHEAFMRHQGHLFLLWVACAWLANYGRTGTAAGGFLERQLRGAAGVLIACLFTVHAMVGILFVTNDWQYPFSASSQAARFLEENGLADRLLVGEPDYAASAVGGHLGRPVYYLSADRMGTYIRWDSRRRWPQLLDAAYAKAESSPEGIVLILNRPLSTRHYRGYRLRRLAEFTTSIVPDEVYFLYMMQAPRR